MCVCVWVRERGKRGEREKAGGREREKESGTLWPPRPRALSAGLNSQVFNQDCWPSNNRTHTPETDIKIKFTAPCCVNSEKLFFNSTLFN